MIRYLTQGSLCFLFKIMLLIFRSQGYFDKLGINYSLSYGYFYHLLNEVPLRTKYKELEIKNNLRPLRYKNKQHYIVSFVKPFV